MIPSERSRERQQLQRIRWIGVVFASYMLDTLFLALFFLAGTIPAFVPLAYGFAAALVCGASYLFFSAGWNRRFRGSSISTLEMSVALTLQCGVVWLAPQIAFPYLANLFTVLAFGVLQLSLRQFALVWAIGTFGVGLTLFTHAAQVGLPASTTFELSLAWLYFAMVLGRCAFLSVTAQGLREKLEESRRKLAATLHQVQQLATRDELTGAFNRRYMMDRLHEEKARFDRFPTAFSVALCDLDRFKTINDAHGHGVGDAVLKAFVRLASETMRTTDSFGRYGGEEFVLLFPATPIDLAMQALERFCDRVRSAPWEEIAAGLSVTVSIGVAESRKEEPVEALLHAADAALYRAKHGGRDRVVGRDAGSGQS